MKEQDAVKPLYGIAPWNRKELLKIFEEFFPSKCAKVKEIISRMEFQGLDNVRNAGNAGNVRNDGDER